MKLSHCLPVLLSVCLAACGGGGGNNGASGNEGGTVTAPTPPVTLRGTLIGATTPVAQVYNGASVATLSPAALSALLNASFSGTTILTGNPTCSVTTYTAHYHTVDSLGADTDASTAIMVPSGTAAACNGPRPVLLYARGARLVQRHRRRRLGPALRHRLFAGRPRRAGDAAGHAAKLSRRIQGDGGGRLVRSVCTVVIWRHYFRRRADHRLGRLRAAGDQRRPARRRPDLRQHQRHLRGQVRHRHRYAVPRHARVGRPGRGRQAANDVLF